MLAHLEFTSLQEVVSCSGDSNGCTHTLSMLHKRNIQIIFPNDCIILHSLQFYNLFAYTLFPMCSLLASSSSTECGTSTHCGINLHFSGDV